MGRTKGQSTIEFLLTFVFGFSFLMTFLQLVLNSGAGYLAHYANFMASRAYLVHDIGSNQPGGGDRITENFIRENVFPKFRLESVGLGDSVENLRFNTPDNSKAQYVGTYFEFKRLFSLFKLVSSGRDLNFRTESFLGREPTRGTCLWRVCKGGIEGQVGYGCNPVGGAKHVTLFDNGC